MNKMRDIDLSGKCGSCDSTGSLETRPPGGAERNRRQRPGSLPICG